MYTKMDTQKDKYINLYAKNKIPSCAFQLPNPLDWSLPPDTQMIFKVVSSSLDTSIIPSVCALEIRKFMRYAECKITVLRS
jgi:hypothetical protein